MITPEYARTMARYNAWQNEGLLRIIPTLSDAALMADRGAFFGSIFGTLNHLLWGDTVWISRFDNGEGSTLSIADSSGMTASVAEWATARQAADARITAWAQGTTPEDFQGDLTWYSGAVGREMSKPRAICAMQMFNHQTHHRGQIHAMLTAAGARPNGTDIPFMPN